MEPSNISSQGPTVSDTPSLPSSLIPSEEPSMKPSTVLTSCSCEKITTDGLGPNVVLCWNSTKPNEYFGIYAATDTSFNTNLILPNPSFPASSTYSCNGNPTSYDNVHPLTDGGDGVVYISSNVGYNIYFDSSYHILACTGGNKIGTYAGTVTCPNNLDLSQVPSYKPSTILSFGPTINPTFNPPALPSNSPSSNPTFEPSVTPTFVPSMIPSFQSTVTPTFSPSLTPTQGPTVSDTPSSIPSVIPSDEPSNEPTMAPQIDPCTCQEYIPDHGPSPIVGCYRSGQYFGVYLGTDTNFTTNLILQNLNFPSYSYLPNCSSNRYFNKQYLINSPLGYSYQSSAYSIQMEFLFPVGTANKVIQCSPSQQGLFTDGSQITCPYGLLQATERLDEKPKVELSDNSTMLATVVTIISVVLVIFCFITMVILYRKHKSHGAKVVTNERKLGELESFYFSQGDNSVYENPVHKTPLIV